MGFNQASSVPSRLSSEAPGSRHTSRKENTMNDLLVLALAIGAGALYVVALAALVTYVPPWVAHLMSSLWHRLGQPR